CLFLRCPCGGQCLRPYRRSLVNTGVSATQHTGRKWNTFYDFKKFYAYGNYAYLYDIKDAATGSINSKAEVGKVGAVAVAAPAVAYGVYAAPAVAAYAAPAVAAYTAPSRSCLCCPSCSFTPPQL
ncbi:hypothetical protein CEXT_14091, partial [Caerostris extrusa]